ncbi:hypothetical protein Tco_1467601 [Tanacetum coccineum]
MAGVVYTTPIRTYWWTPSSSVEALIVVECAKDPFEELDDILGNNSIVDDVLELEMLFETEGVGPVGKFKEVEVDADNE